jgi:hypothetical protein
VSGKGSIVIICLVCKVYFDKFTDEVLEGFAPGRDDTILGGLCSDCREDDKDDEKSAGLSRHFVAGAPLLSRR